MQQPGVPSAATVWVADGSPLPGLDYGTRVCERLRALGVEVTRREFTRPTSEDDISTGINILTGGSTSVHDRTTWMSTGLELTRRMIEAASRGDSTLFGICLGSQMIAECLSPGCIVQGEGIHVGLTRLEWADRPGSGSAPPVLPTFHYEQIGKDALRSGGAEVIASNDAVPVLAYRYGARIGATQLHPDFTGSDATDLVAHHGDLIERFDGDASASGRRTEQLRPMLPDDALERTIRAVLAG